MENFRVRHIVVEPGHRVSLVAASGIAGRSHHHPERRAVVPFGPHAGEAAVERGLDEGR